MAAPVGTVPGASSAHEAEGDHGSPEAKKDVESHKELAALSYIWVLSLVVYFARKDSPFVRFHSKQAIILFFLSVAVWFVPLVNTFLELIVLAFCVIGFLNAAQGQWKDVPFIGALAHKEGGSILHALDQLAIRIRSFFKAKRKEKKEPSPTPAVPTPSVPPPPPPSTPPPPVA